jgi:hypothetical protein
MKIVSEGRAIELTTIKELQMKSGEKFPKGTKITVMPLRKRSSGAMIHIEGREQPSTMSYHLMTKVTDLEMPSDSQFDGWVMDANCETIIGTHVEPDGTDQYGWTSWLKAIGVI